MTDFLSTLKPHVGPVPDTRQAKLSEFIRKDFILATKTKILGSFLATDGEVVSKAQLMSRLHKTDVMIYQRVARSEYRGEVVDGVDKPGVS